MIIIFKIMDFLLDLGFFCILYFIYHVQKNFQIKIVFSILVGVLGTSLIICFFMRKEYRIVITESQIGNNELNTRLEYSTLSLKKFFNSLSEEELNNTNTIIL